MSGDSKLPERPSAKYYGSGSNSNTIDGFVSKSQRTELANENTPRFIKVPRRKMLIIIVSSVAICILAAGVWLLTHRPTADPFSANLMQSVHFPLYYPAKMPKRYRLSAPASETDNNIVQYFLSNTAGSTISITLQGLPKTFDPKSLFGQTTIPATPKPFGTVYQLSGEKDRQARYMVTTTDGTLIFVSSDSKAANASILAIIDSLKPVNR